MMKSLSALALLSILALSTGCDEEEKPTEAEAAPAPAAVAAPKEKTAEEKAKEEAAEKMALEEEEKAAKKEAESAKLDANPLTDCCRALNAKGFTLRSPEYMTAAKACGTAMKASKDMADVLPEIKKELGGKALPEECAE